MASKSVLIGYGELALFKKLIDKINQEFKSNSKYKNSLNTIDIKAKPQQQQNGIGESSLYDMKIKTKYYTSECELHVVSNQDELKAKLTEIINDGGGGDDSIVAEGLLLLVHSGDQFDRFKSIELERYKDTSLGRLSVLLHVGGVDDKVKVDLKNEISKLNDEFYEIDLCLEDKTETNRKECSEDDDDDNDDFSAFDELINCLFVHDWINMSRKNEHDELKSKSKNECNGVTQKSDVEKSTAAVQDEEKTKATATCENDEEFNVENLILNLNELRSKANQMSFDERKMFAEKVVTSFWKSIGGDANELANLDDDDEENHNYDLE